MPLLYYDNTEMVEPNLMRQKERPMNRVVVDKGHPFAPDFCLFPQHNFSTGGAINDLVSGESLTLPAGSLWLPDSLYLPERLSLPTWLWPARGLMTAVMSFSLTSGSSGDNLIGFPSYTGRCYLRIKSASSVTLGFFKDNSSGDIDKTFGNYSLGVGVIIDIGFSYDDQSASVAAIHRGVLYSGSGGTHKAATGDRYINYSNIQLYLRHFYAWNRVIDTETLISVNDSPYQFLIPAG